MLEKYDRPLYDLIQECFSLLPPVTLVNSTVFVVHAGLPRFPDVTIEMLEKYFFYISGANFDRLDRTTYVATETLEPSAVTQEIQIMEDLLWSDPKEITGIQENRRFFFLI